MDPNQQAAVIVNKMYENDAFSKWLGIELLEIATGRCVLRMTVRPEMVNGFGITHGGITFSFADSAFAFASNSQGRKAVSVETSISHLKPTRIGDILIARAEEDHLGNRMGFYRVRVENQEGEKVALFKGTVYRKGEEW